MARWIDVTYMNAEFQPGEVAFLIQYYYPGSDAAAYKLSLTPARQYRDNKPVIKGFCGSYNNRHVLAEGVVRIARLTEAMKAYVVPLEGDSLQSALRQLNADELLDN